MNALLMAFDGCQPLVDAPLWVLLLLKISAILLAAWLAHLALGRANPRWRVFLWRVTAVGLIVLPAIAWLFPALEIHVRPAPAPEMVAVAVLPASKTMIDYTAVTPRPPIVWPQNLPDTGAAHSLPMSPIEPSNSIGSTAVTPVEVNEPEMPAAAPPEPFQISWPAVALSAWFGGIALLGLRLFLGHYWIWRLARGAKRPAPGVRGECVRVAEAIGCRRRVEVVQSAEVESPFLCGLRRPLLLLPARMCEVSYRKDLPGILAHELSHARSNDVLWNVGFQLLSIVLWFHPLVWRMRKAHLAACELVCDAVSASFVGDVAGYCRTLARVAVDVHASLPAAGIAMARTSAISRRLNTLRKKVFLMPLRRRSVLCFGLAALLAVAVIGTLQFALAAPPATEPTGEIPAMLNKPESRPTEPVEKESKPVTNADAKPKTDSAKSAKPGFRPMKILVLDADRKPVPSAVVKADGQAELPFAPITYATDADGTAMVQVPQDKIVHFSIDVTANGCVKAGASWRTDTIAARLPDTFTFTLEPSTAVGGIIHDEQGKPLAGAEVAVGGWKTFPNDPRWMSIDETTTTDADGKWYVHRVPPDLAGFSLNVKVKRPDVAGVERFDEDKLPIEKLRDQTAVLVVRKGVILEGTVTDSQGKPAKGATVGIYLERSGSDCPRTRTDENGRYRIATSAPGKYTVAAVADGVVPDWREITVGKDSQTVDLRLGKGEKISLRVVDQAGKPLPDVSVCTSFGINDSNCRALMLDYECARHNDPAYHSPTDAEGRWSRLWIPKDQIELHLTKEGYISTRKSFAPDEREQVITLESGVWSISGRVVDSKTKAPVTKFRLTEGFSHRGSGDPNYWAESRLVENENGEYRISWNYQFENRIIRIEADGYYASKPSPPLGKKPTQTTFNVELKKGDDITGVVLSPDGKPLANADVALCTPERGLYLRNGRPLDSQYPLIVRTDAKGRFSFPPQKDPVRLVAMHERGFAEVTDQADMKQVTLEPWARAEGTLLVNNQPSVKEHVSMDFGDVWEREPNTLSSRDQSAKRIINDYQTETDEQGHYVFDRVRPGKAKISRGIAVSMNGATSWKVTDSKSVNFYPGKVLKLNLHSDFDPESSDKRGEGK